jgi:hypothetical protein
VSYDFKHFTKWTENKKIQLGAHSDVVALYQAQNTQNTTEVIVAASNTHIVASEALSYGEWYDFSEQTATAKLNGYERKEWGYQYDGEWMPCPVYGYWNKNVSSGKFLMSFQRYFINSLLF